MPLNFAENRKRAYEDTYSSELIDFTRTLFSNCELPVARPSISCRRSNEYSWGIFGASILENSVTVVSVWSPDPASKPP